MKLYDYKQESNKTNLINLFFTFAFVKTNIDLFLFTKFTFFVLLIPGARYIYWRLVNV